MQAGEGTDPSVVAGRLVLDDRVSPGRLRIADGIITAVDVDDGAGGDGPLIAPGYVDIHLHGWGGHGADGGRDDLDGMARALIRRGVTSFLPTAVSAPLPALAAFAESVRAWLPVAPEDAAGPLGFGLEGPFLSVAKAGAQDPHSLRTPAETDPTALDPLIDGLRLMAVAPELDGASDVIRRLVGAGVTVSLGHSAASSAAATAGYDAGARGTTHLFNAMSGVHHGTPGLAAVALARDDAFVELIADGQHVDPMLYSLVIRSKPMDRLVLVSDAIALGGTDARRGTLGGLDVVVNDGRCTLASNGVLAGSVIAIDDAVRNLVAAGVELPRVIAAATRNPLALLGIEDRGRLEVGQRADLVELDDGLGVRRVARSGVWQPA